MQIQKINNQQQFNKKNQTSFEASLKTTPEFINSITLHGLQTECLDMFTKLGKEFESIDTEYTFNHVGKRGPNLKKMAYEAREFLGKHKYLKSVSDTLSALKETKGITASMSNSFQEFLLNHPAKGYELSELRKNLDTQIDIVIKEVNKSKIKDQIDVIFNFIPSSESKRLDDTIASLNHKRFFDIKAQVKMGVIHYMDSSKKKIWCYKTIPHDLFEDRIASASSRLNKSNSVKISNIKKLDAIKQAEKTLTQDAEQLAEQLSAFSK